MKNAFLKKFLCVLSAAVLVFSFAACGNDADEKDTTAPSVLEEENPGADEVPDVSESESRDDVSEGASENDTQAAESEKNDETSAQTGNGGTASSSSKPDSKSDIISAYNSAVTTSGLSRTSMSQKLTKGFISVVSYDIMASEHAGVLNQINVNNTSKTASDLKALSSSDVASATRNGNTVTIKLNTVSGKSSVSNGTGGYVGIIDNSRTNEIVNIITDDIGVNGVTLASSSYTLSNGVITATFNDDFTKITKVTFTGSETFAGKLKYLVMSINADVAANLSSTYSA